MLIANYATRLARIIARAKQQGLVRADVQPSAEAISLVQASSRNWCSVPLTAPQWRGWFLREAVEAFALYRAGLAVS